MGIGAEQEDKRAAGRVGRLRRGYEGIRLVWRTIPSALMLIWAAAPLLLTISLLLTLAVACFPVTTLWITKLTIDRVTECVQARASGLTPGIGAVAFPLIALGVIWIASNLLSAANSYVSSLLRLRADQFVQEEIIKKCAGLDIAFYDDPKNLNTVDNANQGALTGSYGAVSSLFSIVYGLCVLGTFLIALIRLHWLAAVVVTVTVAPQLLISSHFARQRWAMITDRAEESRLRFYCSSILTGSGSAKEVRAFGLIPYLFGRYKYFCEKFIRQERNLQARQETANLLGAVLSTTGSIAVWFYIAAQAINGRITIGDIVLYTGAVSSFRGGLVSLFTQSGSLYQQTLFMGNLLGFLRMRTDDMEGSLRRASPSEQGTPRVLTPSPSVHTLEFRDVSFRYPKNDRWVLRNVSFAIGPGESVAMVGRNGAGKTTLVKLLIRLYDPTEGQILLDGHDLREYDLDRLRRCFGVIFQDYTRYCLTLRENIGLGDVDYVTDMARVTSAAASAGVDHVALNLPDGYETYLAKQFISLGADLSGGEWQKVALARAYMRDCPILVLDEPTASLDAFAEYEVYEAFHRLMDKRTVLFVSHRFSTVRMAEHVLVLDDGMLVEEGTHADLIDAHGLYASMFEAQAVRYR